MKKVFESVTKATEATTETVKETTNAVELGGEKSAKAILGLKKKAFERLNDEGLFTSQLVGPL